MCPTVEHILHREKENTGCRIFDDAITGESWKRRRQSAGGSTALCVSSPPNSRKNLPKEKGGSKAPSRVRLRSRASRRRSFSHGGARNGSPARTASFLTENRKKQKHRAPRSIHLSIYPIRAAKPRKKPVGSGKDAGQGTDKRNPHTDRRCAYTPPCAATQTAGAQGNCLSAYRHKAH